MSVQEAGVFKTYRQGTHRARTPAQSLALLQPLLAMHGITRVGVVTGLDVIGIPVVMVTRPNGRSLSVTQGKGHTLEAAKVSGIMEALEHAHAEATELPLRYGSERELSRTLPMVDTARLQSSSYTVDKPLLWTSGVALASGAERWLPFDLVHLDYRLPAPTGARHFFPSSNGLASGNSRQEAVNHALFELIERHQAYAFFARPRQQAQRRVDLSGVDDPICSQLLAQLKDAAMNVAVWDLSDVLGVPCFLCDILECTRNEFRVLPRGRGLGCHSSKAIALARALCEAAQSRLSLIAGSRDDISDQACREARTPEAWDEAQRAMAPSATPARAYAALASFDFDDFNRERAWLLSRLHGAGCGEPVVVDLSRPELPFHVVRVVVPGLQAHAPHAPAPCTEPNE